MQTAQEHAAPVKPPRPLQVKLPEETDLLIRRTSIEQRKNLTTLIIEAIWATYGPDSDSNKSGV